MLDLCNCRKNYHITPWLQFLHCRASGSVNRPEGDTAEYICIFISPPDKSDTLNQIVFSSKGDQPFGHNQHDTYDTHPHTSMCTVNAKTFSHILYIPSSYVTIIQCPRDLPYSCSGRFATAGVCCTDAEHVNNLLKSFYSSSLSEDRFRTAPLGPDE